MVKLIIEHLIKEQDTVKYEVILSSINIDMLHPLLKSKFKPEPFYLSKSDLIYIIYEYKKIIFDQFKFLYDAKSFKSNAQSFFINQLLNWNQFFDNLNLNEEEKLQINIDEFNSIEIEIYVLISLFNTFDTKALSIILETS